MNTSQTDALMTLAGQFLERAQSYLDQADVCATWAQVETHTKRLQALHRTAVNQPAPRATPASTSFKTPSDQRYYELAAGVLTQIENIFAILDAAGHADDDLARLAGAARNSSALLEAVQSSRRVAR